LIYEIELSKNFTKQLDKLSIQVVKRFYEDLNHICENPLPSNKLADIKKLQGVENQYRLRIGKYRFLFTLIKEKIIVYFYDLDSRGDIYK
jgi:mRNA interferase RelE/StbE